MKRRLILPAMLLTSLLAVPCVMALAEDDAAEEPALLCPISGRKVNTSATAEHNGGTIYFCCGKCVKAFNADPSKHATKSNYQLVASGQAKQQACPITGKPSKAETAIEVGDAKVSVAFCCKRCKAKASGATGDDQLAMLFGEKAFEKGFKVPSE